MKKNHGHLKKFRPEDMFLHPSLAGFTLIEVLVAMGLFLVAVGMATTGFITVLRTDREIGTFIGVETNTNLSVEQMAREIRTGADFKFGGDTSQLLFTNANGVAVLYCRKDFGGVGSILRVFGSGAASGCATAGAQYKITADDVNISSLSFTILSCPNADPSICPAGDPALPPRITLTARVAAAPAIPAIPPVDLQTTVSARNFNP